MINQRLTGERLTTMPTIHDRRKSDRQRQKRWREKQISLGKKQISAMISLKAQLILNREKKRSGETNSQVIERAILKLVDK
ncbi:MAG: hypothetical protein PVG41_10280 [Desulfobacteraceae bacterium]